MDGDLSLSQTLGGLRIANPDDDVLPLSSSPVQSSLARTQTHSTISSLPSAGSGRQGDNHLYPPSNEARSGNGDPELSAYSVQPQSYSAGSSYSSVSHNVSNQDYPQHNGERIQPGIYKSHDNAQAIPRMNRNPASGRPVSGLYSHSNISSGSTSLPESMYQRLRAESGQSSNSSHSGTVRRSNSRSATAALQGALPIRAPNANVYRQSSQSHHHPPTHSRGPGEEYNYNASSQISSRRGSHNPPPPPNAEDAHERTAATTAQHPSDQNAKPASRMVKKGVKDFNFGRTLGEGSYSTVLAAADRQTGREYAIKVLDKRHIIKEKKVKYVNIEKDTLNRLTDHPGVVRLYYTFQDERSLYFVLDLASGGELLGHLKKTGSFDEECTRFYGAQILDSVEYMHERGIIHRDLKPENVLLDDQMHVKITDFGTAKILDLSGKSQFGAVSVNNDPLDGADTDRAVSFVGTAEYVSPELLTEKNACKASDLWAFGCIIFQLLAGRPPFKAANEYLTFQKIVRLEYMFPESFPAVAKDLVTKLLVLDPTQRPHINSIKQHPFFEGIQWGKGLWKQKAPRLKPYNPLAQNASAPPRSRDLALPAAPIRQSSYTKLPPPTNPSQPTHSRPSQAIITELAPPTQLDIDWSPVLTKANERILKLGQFVITSIPAPHSPTSKHNMDLPVEAPSKLSRLFGASGSKKRQRLVMVTSGGRLIIAPAGGDPKVAKLSVELTDPDVSWRSHTDSKGYTVWCIYTRDKHLTFEDPKTNTGDSGSSVRSTQEWLSSLEDIRQHSLSQQQQRINLDDDGVSSPYTPDGISMSGLSSPSLSIPSSAGDGGMGSPGLMQMQMQRPGLGMGLAQGHGQKSANNTPMLRKTLRRNPDSSGSGRGNGGGGGGGGGGGIGVSGAGVGAAGAGAGGGNEELPPGKSKSKIWGNRRHSKNGLAAVF